MVRTQRGVWYRTKTGFRVKLLPKKQRGMNIKPGDGYIPYSYPGNSRAKNIEDRRPWKGWMPPDYPLLPIT